MTNESRLPFETVKKEVLVRRQAKTEPKFGIEPAKRKTDDLINYGVVNIDKPKGPTSHQVSAYVQKILGINKSGHSGTLDPNVTGVLPVALGDGTKVVQALLSAGKEYIAIMHIHKALDAEKVIGIFKKFTGEIKQLPPIKSSVKRQWRSRRIYYLELLELKEKDVLFRVGCEAGTYIRKLCNDMGVALGTGAHMSELRRTKAGPFDESTLVTMQELADALHYYREDGNERYLRKVILPVEQAVEHLQKVWVLDTAVNTLCHGASLKVPGVSMLDSTIKENDLVAVMTLKDELVALGAARMDSNAIMKSGRGIAVGVRRVFMKPGIYPRIEMKLPDN